MSILNVKAEWHVKDGEEEKTDEYKMINLINVMAGNLANSNDKGFFLSRTCTESRYVYTEWSNGIIEVGAETFKDYNGEPTSHHYYIRPCEEQTND